MEAETPSSQPSLRHSPEVPGERVEPAPSPSRGRFSSTTPRRRGASFAGPLLLYFLVGLGILRPFRGSAFRGAGDLSMVMTMIAEARDALREGQFPIRVAPHLQEDTRYPLFQYYGNFPYTVTGYLCNVPGIDPFLAWKIVSLGCLLASGFFVLRLAYLMSGSFSASVLSGLLFQVSPYLLTDLNARGAFTEFVAFNLLPAAFYFTFRTFQLPRWRYVVACAVAWSLITLTHNITYLYGVLFAMLMLLGSARAPRPLPRLFRLALAGALHAGLIVWYVVPQFYTVSILRIQYSGNPFDYHRLTPLSILFAPELANTYEGGSTPGLGLQIGLPIVLSAALALAAALTGRGRKKVRKSIVRLVVLFGIALFIAWSPFDFWQYLPRLFWFVQFPYRLLMFVVLFGSLLGACCLAAYFGRKLPGAVWLIALGLIGFCTASFIPAHQGPVESLADNMESARHGPGFNDYLPKVTYLSAGNITDANPDNFDWKARVAALAERSAVDHSAAAMAVPTEDLTLGGVQSGVLTLKRPAVVELPVLYYPRLLEVSDNGHRIKYGNAGRYVALRLNRGRHSIEIRFVGIEWANTVSRVAWTGLVAGSVLAGLWLLWRTPGVRRWLAATRRTPVTPLRAAAFFAVLVASVALPLAKPFNRSLTVRAKASSIADNRHLPHYAFDGLADTAWAAQGAGPAVLTAILSRPATLRGVILRPRETALTECWRSVRIVAIEHGRQVYQGSFDFPDAAHLPLEVVTFPPVRADTIEFHFSDPVTQRHDGTTVPLDQLAPGYSEIQFVWQGDP